MNILDNVLSLTKIECEIAVYSQISECVLFNYWFLSVVGVAFMLGLFLSLAFSNWIGFFLRRKDGEEFEGVFCVYTCVDQKPYGYPLSEVLFWTLYYIPHMINQLLLAGHVSNFIFALPPYDFSNCASSLTVNRFHMLFVCLVVVFINSEMTRHWEV